MSRAARLLPVLDWGRRYDRATLAQDLVAAAVVTIMLVPQSLAYALIAGMPPEAGIYASIVPILLYALFGTSRSLAVGPVAVVSLLTASAVGEVAAQGTAGYATAALTLAALSGAMLLAMGLLRMGALADLLSHPVIAGFVTASAVLIAAGQMGHLLGIGGGGHALPDILASLASGLERANGPTLLLGGTATAFLWWVRGGLAPLLVRAGLRPAAAALLARTGPVLAVAATTLAAWGLDLPARGVAVVGDVPRGLPPFTLPSAAPDLVAALLLPAALIALIGFVESVSVARTLAAKRGERIDPDQELIGLGAANLGASLSGGFPVTGGFARSVVNHDAGAATPAAGAFTALALAGAGMTLTPLLFFLPKATLAATIVVAVLSLIDLSVLRRTWAYAKGDFAAVAATIAATLMLGVEIGVATGVALSLALLLARTARPHVAEVGRVPGTEHFRNVLRRAVETDPRVLTLRVDESLTFANARMLEDLVLARMAERPGLRDVVLMLSAVNAIDFSALETLEALNRRVAEAGLRLHLSEVKGPVMDRLRRGHLLRDLSGGVFLSQHDAARTLSAPEPPTLRRA
ncbi:sulfate permease [Jannaschia sp. Os4]|uniref:sulfate permease n=1 Tax=Jannaschia sp. Os4 TaxID=2807617 RepID=UPI00193A0E5B|nr:sulfate permease [Jannaschia sp. Os4]